MNYIIFGGSGFIGTHLIKLLKAEVVKESDNIYDLDIVMPGEEGVVPGMVERIEDVNYIRLDVRKKIEFNFTPTKDDIIFNLAAVHRTPGHLDKEYFQTNILGAERVTEFAEKYGINKILFTSSIAPYGAAEQLKKESTLPTPNSPYGISKLVAEKIHTIWQVKDLNRELTIVRPGVVYGKGEHGNFTRLYWGIRKRYFFYTGRRDTIKACIYVKELVRFIKYRMIDSDFKGTDIFNCTFEPAYTIAYFSNIGQDEKVRSEIGAIRRTNDTVMGQLSDFLKNPKFTVRGNVECRVKGNTISYRHPNFTDKSGKLASVRGNKLGEKYTVKGIEYELRKKVK